METTEAAWLAGLVEGEGWLGSTAIRIEMTDSDVVARAATLMQGSFTPRPRRGNNKLAYRANVYGPQAVQVMSAIRPYMGERRGHKIDLVLAQYFRVPVQDQLW